jgi:predicted aldo/keto reductase-like oxidoreductase
MKEEARMETIRLGRTDLRVSRVGFGGIPIQRVREEDATTVIRRAFELGVTFFDTANGYGTSEERIGRALAGRRQEVVLATKTMARDRAEAERHLDLSLGRLLTDSIDLWQFHAVNTEAEYSAVLSPGGAMEAAKDALRRGTVQHVGLTSHSMEIALKAVASGHFETIQFPFNYVTREAEDELIPLAANRDVGFIGMKPFAGGMLSDARLSIRYVLQYSNVMPDPGVETVADIEGIVDILGGSWELTSADLAQIDRIRAELGNRFCRRCGYCMPCPEGIPITTALNVISFARRFPTQQVRDGSVGRVAEKAKACVKCGTCESRCPYNLPIREMLVENVAYYETLA